MTRTRYIEAAPQGYGTVQRPGYPPEVEPWPSPMGSVCRDTAGKVQDQPLEIIGFVRTGGHFSVDHFSGYKIRNRMATRYPFGVEFDLGPTFDTIDNRASLTEKLLSETNPSKPDVSVPNFFWELREVPELMYTQGRNILQHAASANLAYWFGWRPLVSDIGKFLDFSQSVNKRFRFLQDAKRDGQKKVKKHLADFESKKTRSANANSVFQWIDVTEEVLYREEVWGYTRWVPDFDIGSMDLSDANSRIFRNSLGLDRLQLSQVWEALPWSWLIDWFGNVQNILMACENSAGFHYENPCICSTRETSVSTSSSTFKDFVPFYQKVTVKNRMPGTFERLNRAVQPVLDGRQFGILASLALQRI